MFKVNKLRNDDFFWNLKTSHARQHLKTNGFLTRDRTDSEKIHLFHYVTWLAFGLGGVYPPTK